MTKEPSWTNKEKLFKSVPKTTYSKWNNIYIYREREDLLGPSMFIIQKPQPQLGAWDRLRSPRRYRKHAFQARALHQNAVTKRYLK